jgi:starch phosphorylase
MTCLALNLSGYVNGVAQRHEEVSEEMFPGYPIHHITNGIHSATWTADSFKILYDRHIPGWRNDPPMLRHALRIPADELWAAHQAAKARLLALVRERTGALFQPEVLTLGIARRATSYKRLDLLLADLDRLQAIARDRGRFQVVFAGKAHPDDLEGKRVIQRVVAAGRRLGVGVPVVYLADYDLDLARILVSGVDLWLNTPLPPLEASGTSGMKAAHNGVPSLSVLDGWWLEGHIEGITGWSIGDRNPASSGDDAQDLYAKLEHPVLPLYYERREAWIDVMRHAIALNAAYFNTHRMVQEYVAHAYV